MRSSNRRATFHNATNYTGPAKCGPFAFLRVGIAELCGEPENSPPGLPFPELKVTDYQQALARRLRAIADLAEFDAREAEKQASEPDPAK